VAEAEGFFLNHHPDLDLLQAGQPSFHQEVLLDEVAGVEIDHHDDLGCPRPRCFFDNVLNCWTVDDGQQALGDHSSRRSHPGPPTSGRNYSYLDGHEITFCSARLNIRDMFPRCRKVTRAKIPTRTPRAGPRTPCQ